MIFNRHSDLEGTHAFLSPSNYHWLSYSPDKMKEYVVNNYAKIRGVELHEIAADLIKHRIRLPRNKKAFNAYVNDAISYNMSPEVVLKYSNICYGTADAIAFDKGILRIHDLKTGKTKPSMKQLEAYAALFILEYAEQLNFDPMNINIELRIYQIGEPVLWHTPENSYILDICEAIKANDKIVKQTQSELFLEE